ncbi:S-layer homology domain-containing protein [Scytonema millei]|uniref:S-layer homology domain-containing protein n=1 Tax=Scytonema millei VB511283 TaxID=1245923 RepID=A0A9X5I5T4_9CYAN|nr:S-layer homology domain-containing protein [Scytonema millei]NHC36375.1 S-layer homology domain-containing protein [Scytonema millei VB511283]
MFFSKSARLASLTCLLLAVTACANSPNAQQLERTLAADPELETNRPFSSSGTSTQTTDSNRQNQPNGAIAQLPSDFPSEIPPFDDSRYDTQLVAVTQANEPQQPNETRWVTTAPINAVQSFYQQEFQKNNWQVVNPPSEGETNNTTIEARQNDLLVKIAIAPRTTSTPPPNATPTPNQPNPGIDPAASTEFTIQYQRNAPATAATPTPPQASEENSAQTQTGNPVTSDTAERNFNDLSQAPQELQQYITDLAALGVLPLEPTNTKSSQADSVRQFNPSKIVSRREFARWLFEANNRIQATRPALQIRAASSAAQPAFRDVPRNDPDFSVIQGLAEAGLIPSSLSGDGTAVLFRPDAPLTREQLILWKVPLDTRQALPNASLEAVKESWGFQDAARIDPKALRAVIADFQNGEQSNIRRVFGYTTLLQPKKPVTRAEAASAIWFFGNGGEGMTAQEALKAQQQPQNNQQPPNQQPPNQPQPQPTASP